MTDTGDKAAFTMSERAFWWLKFWVAVLAVSGSGLAGVQWGLTRASKDDIVDLDKRKEEKVDAEKARGKLEQKIDSQTEVIGNVRDNVIILMERFKAEPKPLPNPLPEPRP